MPSIGDLTVPTAGFDRIDSQLGDIRAELIGLQRQFAQAGWARAGAVFVQLIAIIVTAALS